MIVILSDDDPLAADNTNLPSITTDTQQPVVHPFVQSQADNRANTWSRRQASKASIYQNNARFIQSDLSQQPRPLAAIQLIADCDVHFVEDRIVACDGSVATARAKANGNSSASLGHPRVYINLDAPNQAIACGYCGQRYQQKHHH